ncbi:MAG: hypothetical protein ACRDI2_03065 [Chloroflexota bacterium]
MRLSAGHYNSFVVRVWSGDGAPTALRGQITHVASHQTIRFSDLRRMLSFIEAHLGPPAESATTGDQELPPALNAAAGQPATDTSAIRDSGAAPDSDMAADEEVAR